MEEREKRKKREGRYTTKERESNKRRGKEAKERGGEIRIKGRKENN